jgi:hypothetical protein
MCLGALKLAGAENVLIITPSWDCGLEKIASAA